MIIDEECLMRGAAHRFLLIKTPQVKRITGALSESGLFYVYVSKFGAFNFALVAIQTDSGFAKLDKQYYLNVHDVDNCHCEVVDPSILSEDIRILQDSIEAQNAVSQKRIYLRAMSGLDPYRLKIERDILEVYSIYECRKILVLAECLKGDYITAKRVRKNKDGTFETGDDTSLIVIRHQYTMEIYGE